MEILCAELNYLSNVKPRSTNKILRNFSRKYRDRSSRAASVSEARQTSLKSSLNWCGDGADRANPVDEGTGCVGYKTQERTPTLNAALFGNAVTRTRQWRGG